MAAEIEKRIGWFQTPVPRARISDETINTLNSVSSRLQGIASKNSNLRIRFRRLPNLRDMLTKTSIIYPSPSTVAPTLKPPICTRLGKCTYCPLIKKINTIKCNFTKKSYQLTDLPKHITCELSNVIYLISCKKCHKHYVGETSRAFGKRMYEHKFSVQNDGQVTPVSCHVKSEGHNHRDMLFSVLEWCTPRFEHTSTSRRRRLELAWIFKLHCLAPIGINQFV